MIRTFRLHAALLAGILSFFAVDASAQSVLIEELASFKGPYTILRGAVAQTADGSIYGLLSGGARGAIYKAVPNGSGGYTQTVVYEFGIAEGITIFQGFGHMGLVAAPDGKLYYVSEKLWRFDPGAGTVEPLQPMSGFATSLTMGHDGHTIFGGTYQGQIFSFDTTTDTYRDIPSPNLSGLDSLAQSGDGSLIVAYSPPGQGAHLRRIDPVTGTQTGAFHEQPAGLTPLSKGDDGRVYFQLSTLWGRTYYRIEPGCQPFLCLIGLFGEPFPTPAVRSIAGPRNGLLYIDRGFSPHRLDLNVQPWPRLEQLAATANTSKYTLLPDGTLMMFDNDVAYALNTNTAVPNATPVVPVAHGLPNDGADGFPTDYTEGPDGMLYGVSSTTTTNRVSIYRINPNTKARAIATVIDFGPMAVRDWDHTTTPMQLLPDGRMYGTYLLGNYSSAIFRFDPATNAVDLLHEFPLDLNSWTFPDGLFVQPPALGSDGWLYGAVNNHDGPDGSGAIFKVDPVSGAFLTLAKPVFPAGFYPEGAMIEASPGIWIGRYTDFVFSACALLFRFDAATNTVTPFKSFHLEVDGCNPTLIRRADGAIFGSTTTGPRNESIDGTGQIFRLDPVTGDITTLHQFLRTDAAVYRPTGELFFGADGFLYGTYRVRNDEIGLNSNGLMRLDPTNGTFTPMAELPDNSVMGVRGFFPSSDGRVFAGTRGPLYAAGVLDAMPIAPASAPFGGTTTVSATLKALGVPMPGRTITFTLNGLAIGSAITSAQGVAALSGVSVSGIAIGTHADAIGASFAGDDYFPATSGSGSLTVYDVPTPGLIIGHGFVRDDNAKHELAFIVVELADGGNVGSFELTRKSRGNSRHDRFVSLALNGVVFEGDRATFAGTGTWNGVAGYRFQAVAEDVAGPGNHDTLRVTIYDGGNHVVVTFDQEIDGGNIQSLRLRR